MQILVNGDPRDIPRETTAAQLLDLMAVGQQRLALEVNEEIVPRSHLPIRQLQEGDRVEIVRAIGGG